MRFLMTWMAACCLWATVGQAQTAPVGDAPKLNNVDEILRKKSVWTTTPEQAEKTWTNYGFRWTDENKTSGRSVMPGLAFRDIPVVEGLVYFEEGTCSGFTLNIYTRGDVGDVREEEFLKVLAEVEEAVGAFMQTKPRDLKNFGTSGINKEAKVWAQQHLAIQLEWSITEEDHQKRPEFMRLRIFKADDGAVSLVKRGPERVRMTALRQNLVKGDNGDIYVGNVPMVDQGQKGYCAVAVTERMLRYYGRDVDQHEIAQIAKTGDMGTSQQALVDGLKQNGSKLGLSVEVLDEWDIRQYKAMVKAYNRLARKKNEREISDNDMRSGQALDMMQAEILIEARATTPDYDKFKNSVVENVKKGIPVTWVVMLGLVKETPPVGAGGHMRLIIGYNDETDEILYSDTWGAGHELKRMKTAEAFGMTRAYLVMLPR